MKKIAIFGTGGTMAGVAKNKADFQHYRSGLLEISDMVREIGAEIFAGRDAVVARTEQVVSKDSNDLTFEDLRTLSLKIDDFLQGEGDGAVVTCGTDTMEELAYFLDLTIRSDKPVVVTGSMRPWAWSQEGSEQDGQKIRNVVLGSDAPANLLNAVALAASGKTRRFGTVVMLNDTIYAAREVTKTNAQRLHTFGSPLGPLGCIDEKLISIYHAPVRALRSEDDWATAFDLRACAPDEAGKTDKIGKNMPKVGIAAVYQEAGGEPIRAFAQAGYAGIVLAATGFGGFSADVLAARREAIRAHRVLFVTASRTGSGTTYEDIAPEDEEVRRNILPSDSLNPAHARVLLILSLLFAENEEEAKRLFSKHARFSL